MATSTSTKRCRVVVFGVGGNMGKIRTQLCYESPRFTLCGVSDVVFDKAQQMAERYETTAFTDFDYIIQHFNLVSPKSVVEQDTSEERHIQESSLDAIIISVPTDFHGGYIRQAAKYGLGVFVEKPVAETPDEICELYNLCSTSRVPLCCGFQRRFDPSYVDAARAIHENKIGDRPISAHIFFGDSPGPPMSFLKSRGGEIFMDLCVHDVDFIQWALNDEIESVYAIATSSTDELKKCNVQDNATMMMTTRKNKTVITLSMSRRAVYGYDQRCEVFGNGGMISVGNCRETTTCLSNPEGDHFSRLQNSYDVRFNEAFCLELDTFADIMQSGQSSESDSVNGKQWPVGRDDVVSVQRVAKAAKDSFEKGTIIYL